MNARHLAKTYTLDELNELIEITKDNAYALGNAVNAGMSEYRDRAHESLETLTALREAKEIKEYTI